MPQIFSIGHSTRPIESFLSLLQAQGVRVVADVRTIPRSRRNPQYSSDELSQSLTAADIRYVRIPELGGLRRRRPDSPNGGWHNPSFQGYADHMDSEEFECGLTYLLELAKAEGLVAMMCAEAVPWRCHRSLIADALDARGVTVQHIIGPGSPRPHTMTRFARIDGHRVIYPPE
jgi:uncharacterized protein (DUF488 family)